MFTILKLLKPFVLPPILIALGMAISLFLFSSSKYMTGEILLLLVFLIYYLLSINLIASFLSLSLMHKIAVKESEINLEKADVIVVLAGGVLKKNGDHSYYELCGRSWRRLWHGIEVYKKLQGQKPLLYVGGEDKTSKFASVEVELAKRCAVEIGIPNEKFWTESNSRNTYESGIEIKQILDMHFPEVKRHIIILVTSATHMMRAKMVMGKIGLDTFPSPADLIGEGISLKFSSFIPTVGNFSASYFAIHEWIGIVGYKLLGRI